MNPTDQASYGTVIRTLSTHPMLPYDVRLRRELTHRRLAVSLVRRMIRVLTLHILDAALIFVAVLLLGALQPAFTSVRPLAPAIVAILLLSLNALSAYAPGEARRDWRRLFYGVGLALLILFCLTVFPPGLPLAPFFLAVLGAVVYLALAGGRALADQIVRQAYLHGIGLRRAVLVGNLDEVGRAIHQLRDHGNIDQYVVGHLAPDDEPDPAALGVASDIGALLDQTDVQEILVATTLPAEQMQRIIRACFERGTMLYVMPSVIGTLNCWAEPARVAACPVLRLHPARLEFPALLLKRVFDVAGASLALILAAPLMLLIALAVKLDSPGPVFFRQRRVGVGGRTFTIWKFRCMFQDAEDRKHELAHLNIYGNPRLFKLPNDPRVTRMGGFLRRSSLDELPQLFNVLFGDMSLVGPRPPIPSEVDSYEPHHYERLSVVPGITGPWQVGGRNLITDFEVVVQMERAYISSWSLLLDAKILFRTFGVVFRGWGAY
ncbi:MAG: sugar transferase [Gemmatimonadota bacterium]|jgi:exopolysaccharide biosynthesis polyprenyl glycosylphosphotransferase|nr:sugar transferase [Gemmatimonadota bacterium]